MQTLERVHRLGSVEMQIEAELARTWVTVGDLLALAPGSFLEIDRGSGDMALRVGGALLGWGEATAPTNERRLRITRLASPKS